MVLHTRFQEVTLPPVRADEFLPFISFAARRRKMRAIARSLRSIRVVHINATPFGGGVAELLKSQIPYERSLGIDSRWLFIRTDPEFFSVTKKIHNLLQGMPGFLNAREQEVYRAVNIRLGRLLEKIGADILMVHDPQPMRIVSVMKHAARCIARIHIDLSTPNRRVLDFFRSDLERYHAVIFTQKEFIPAWFPRRRAVLITPAIDPLREKNKAMDRTVARKILETLGVHPLRPLVSQVSRFDKWKDPLGVVDAYYRARNHIPDLQLILEGVFIAQDDPEAIALFKKVQKFAHGDPALFLFANPALLKEVSIDTLVNAVQSGSDIVLQKSIREGFGMTATEAMWKGMPVIGGNTIGIRSQITNGKNGYLVRSSDEAARKIVYLLRNPRVAARIGRAGKRTVARKFLFPDYILKHMVLYKKLLSEIRL